MAQVDLQDDPDRPDRPGSPGTPGTRVGGSVYSGANGPIDVAPGLDVSAIERELRDAGGGLFDKSDLEGILRNTGYNNGGVSLDTALSNAKANYAQRRANNPGPSAPAARSLAGDQFDDAYTNQLEGIAKAQMGEVRSNPGLNDLMAFLEREFTRLSTSPGFSPEETALLHTQALEPIEQRRQASNTRALERAGARGFLPTSGLTYMVDAPSGGVESLDTAYDRMRTTADRDLALANVNQRRADLNQAVQLGSLRGLDIPKSQRAEELMLSQLLYQLPRNALQDLMMVLGGSSSPNDIFSQALNASNQSNLLRQQDDARNAALMSQIGAILGTLFR